MKPPNMTCPAEECGPECCVVRHGFQKTKTGRRRRYRCRGCDRTFTARTNSTYKGLHCSSTKFDLVAHLSVEGMSQSAIARVVGVARSTAIRWLDRMTERARVFNERHLKNVTVRELQADELRTFIDSKKNEKWVFAALEVGSRLWLSTVVGRRSYRNTEALFRDVIRKSDEIAFALLTTDGFVYYQRVIWNLFGPAVLYGVVQKTRREDRVIRVEREERIGAHWRIREALLESEDSETLNTSFIERLNLFIRHASSYLGRRTLCHARDEERLDDHLALVQWYYNFGRSHAALRFGREVRTPAMQAGLMSRKLTFRDLFVLHIVEMFQSMEHEEGVRKSSLVIDSVANLLEEKRVGDAA